MRVLTQEELKSMTLDEAKCELGNRLYEASALIERLEIIGKCHGNGHHARQQVCALGMEVLERHWNK